MTRTAAETTAAATASVCLGRHAAASPAAAGHRERQQEREPPRGRVTGTGRESGRGAGDPLTWSASPAIWTR